MVLLLCHRLRNFSKGFDHHIYFFCFKGRREPILQGSYCRCELGISLPTLARRGDFEGPAVSRMSTAFHKAAIFQKYEHGPDGVRVGGGAMGELLLGDAIFFGEQGQEYELVGGHIERGKVGIGLAVH